MVVMSCSQLSKSFGEEILFDKISFHVQDNDKIGLVGVNGTGKTTLFKIINGEMSPSEGQVHISRDSNIGYMEQHACSDMNCTVYEEVLRGFNNLIQMENQLDIIAQDIHNGKSDINILIKKQQELLERYELLGGLTYKNRIKSAIVGMGFSKEDLDRQVSTLSGGQKSKISLVKMLLSNSKFLLLDEPTNHLDIDSVQWLEDFLISYQGAFIVISHDRYFLDRVTKKTLELSNGKLRMFNGCYSEYLKEKVRTREIEEHHYENTMREIKRIEGIIEQQRRWNREKNIRTAENKQKMVDRLKATLVKPEKEESGIRFNFEIKEESGEDVIIAENLSKSFGEKLIFSGADLHIQKTERVFLLGPNGCGKTTLLKILAGQLIQDTGYIRRGTGLMSGYYDQTLAGLNMQNDVISEVWNAYPKLTQTQVRNALAVFLFTGDDVFKQISSLSGGERARIVLLKLMLSGCNFLLLDEPTNHLDAASREALEQALMSYPGTLLMVSHDRYFINRLADRILYMEKGKLLDFDGDYDYFKQHYIPQQIENNTELKNDKPKVNIYKLKKENESLIRRTMGQISRLEEDISQQEKKISSLQLKLSTPQIAADYEQICQINSELDEENKTLDDMYVQWEELSEQLKNAQLNRNQYE